MKREVKTLINLALKVNDRTEHHVFIDVSPHVKGLSFRIYEEGWKTQESPDYSYTLYYDRLIDPSKTRTIKLRFADLLDGEADDKT